MRRDRGDSGPALWVGVVRKHRRKWRFPVATPDAPHRWYSYDTQEEAERERKLAIEAERRRRQEQTPKTLEEALEEYAVYKERRGNKPRSVETEIGRVARFFGRDSGDLPALTPQTAQAQYRRLVESITRTGRKISAAEQQCCLKAARRFGAWLIKERHWSTNPLLKVEMEGRALAGEESKPQLSRDQGRLWLQGALALFELGDQSALAAAVLIVMGVRVSEIASRRVSHLDDGGHFLRILKAKTDAGNRGLPVPYPSEEHPDAVDLVTPLRQQADRAKNWGRTKDVPQLDPPLFPPIAYDSGGQKVTGEHLSRYSVRRAVHRVCRSVGLPLVCPHALRGTFASRGAALGVAIWAVAGDLGQAGDAVTKRHYVSPEARAIGQQESRLHVLRGAR